MKAVAKLGDGPGLELIDVSIPVVGPKDVLIKVEGASVCGSDLAILDWDDAWTRETVRPGQIIGHEFCGRIASFGSQVEYEDDSGGIVTGEGHLFCGTCLHCRIGEAHICLNQRLVGFNYPGAFAEYIVIPAANLIPLPKHLSVAVASILDPFGNAVHAASSVCLTNATVLVTGCGPIGLMTILLARNAGAHHIWAVDRSTYRLALAGEMGADSLLNPLEEDIAARIRKGSSISTFSGVDVWFEMSGATDAITTGFQCLRPGGEAVLLGLPKKPVQFDFANDLVAKGVIVKGIIGRRLFETWAQVLRLIDIPESPHLKALETLVTHQLELGDFETAFNLMKSGQCGKVVMLPKQH